MDKIIGFSDDELLVKILSFLPTKVAVSTSILSKQWKFLWTRVPKLEYDDTRIKYHGPKCERMQSFIDMNLPLHRAPVIESLCLKLHTKPFQPEDIKLWVEIAVSRCLRELSITYVFRMSELKALLPSSLYTCKSLVTLKLKYGILDVPHVVSLPSLKTLHLRYVEYAGEESLQRLLSNCSVLEDLFVECYEADNLRKLAVIIPSLLSLSFEVYGCSDVYVIDTPSLKYFKTKDIGLNSSCSIVNMPKLEEADITLLRFPEVKKLLEPVTSVKRLSLYLLDKNAEAVYDDDDIVFNELEHLKFRIANTNGSTLLLWLLKISPKLRDLEFIGTSARYGMDTSSIWWKQLICVPECLLSSLQTFKWTCYCPIAEEIELATYILRNSCRLKTARFLIGSRLDPQKKLEMKNELVCSPRGSTTCNLVFG